MFFWYIFQFSNNFAAFNDPVVGPLLNQQILSLDLWVYDLRKGGVITEPGFWCVITANYPDVGLLANNNLQFVVDIQAATQNSGSGIVATNRSLDFLRNVEVLTPYGAFIVGLKVDVLLLEQGGSLRLVDGNSELILAKQGA